MRNSGVLGTVSFIAAVVAPMLTLTMPLLAAPKDVGDVQQAMSHLALFDGVWRGPAERIESDGKVTTLAMVTRVGPMVDSTVRVLEERTSSADGRPVFHLLAVFSFDSATHEYEVRTYALGDTSSSILHPTPNGYYFELPGPGGTTKRFTWVMSADGWHETVEKLVAGQAPVVEVRVHLKHTGTSDWPNGEFPE